MTSKPKSVEERKKSSFQVEVQKVASGLWAVMDMRYCIPKKGDHKLESARRVRFQNIEKQMKQAKVKGTLVWKKGDRQKDDLGPVSM